jgi:hypothetical protein
MVNKVECRKIPIQGAQSGRYFSYPELEESSTAGDEDTRLFCSAEFERKVLANISACSGVGIYSLKLTYEDGSQSPLFGSRPETT